MREVQAVVPSLAATGRAAVRPARRSAFQRAASALVGTLLATLGWAGAMLATAPSADAATCGPAAAGQVAVVVVIDRGSVAPSQHCVTVPEGSSGMVALKGTGLAVDTGSGGFVCAIGGLPTGRCAIDDPNAPSWSYWHAEPGHAWTFSRVGAAGYRLPKRCAVEGWSFGPAGQKSPPRVAPPAVRCEQPAPPARPAPAPTAPPSGGGGGAPAVPQPGQADPSGGRGSTPAPGGGVNGNGRAAEPEAPSSSVAPTTAPESSTADDPAAKDSAVDEAPEPSDGDQPRPGGEGEGQSAAEDRARDGSSDEGIGLPMGATSSRSDGGSWVGAAVVAALLAALGGGAALRSRRSGRAPGSD